MESRAISKKGILLVILATLFTAAGLISFKYGAKYFSFSFSILFNYLFILGAVLYIAGAACLIMGLKYGELSTLYPFIALSYVWTFLFSIIFFGENSHTLKIIGCILIIFGVSLLGIKGNSKKKKKADKNRDNKHKESEKIPQRNKKTGKARGAK